MDWEGGGTLNQGGTSRKADLLMIIFSSRRRAPPGVTFQQRGPPDVCVDSCSASHRPDRSCGFLEIMPAAQTKCGFLHTTVPVMYVCAPQRWCSRNLVVSRTVVCCGLGREMAPRPHAMSRLTHTISATGLIKIWLLRINFIGHVCTCKSNEFNSVYLISHKI